MKRTAFALVALVSLSGCSVLPEGDALFDEGFLSSLHGANGEDQTTMGMGALARGDLVRAEQQFHSALSFNPNNVHALLGLGILYHNTGQETRARQMYEAVIALRPGQDKTMVVWPSTQTRPVSEIASVNLDLLASGVTPQGAGGVPAAIVRQDERPMVAAQPMGAPRQMQSVQPVQPSRQIQAQAMEDVRFADSDANILARFQTLRTLLDQGLITQDEFITRRQANVGALLPLSSPPPAAGLDRPVPTAEQISGRLRAIARAMEMRALSVAQHQSERMMILDALMPAAPRSVAAPAVPPKGLMAAADAVRRLEHLREVDVITSDEYTRERAAIEASMTPPKPPAQATPAPTPEQATSGAPPKALSGFQPAVHLASYQNRAAAEKGWKALSRTHGALLKDLMPSFERVDLGAKGVFIRLKVGPLPSNAAAKDLCRKLKAKRQYCEPTTIHYG